MKGASGSCRKKKFVVPTSTLRGKLLYQRTSAYACVCEKEREGEKERKGEREGEKGRERGREREKERKGERERGREYVSILAGEKLLQACFTKFCRTQI